MSERPKPWPWPTRMPNVVALEAIVRLLAEQGVPIAAPKDRSYLIDLMREHGYVIPGDLPIRKDGTWVESTVIPDKGRGQVIEQVDEQRVKVEWVGGVVECEWRDELRQLVGEPGQPRWQWQDAKGAVPRGDAPRAEDVIRAGRGDSVGASGTFTVDESVTSAQITHLGDGTVQVTPNPEAESRDDDVSPVKRWLWPPGISPTNEQLRSVLASHAVAVGRLDSRDSLLRMMRKVGYALPVGTDLSDPHDTEAEAARLRMVGLNTQLAIEAYRRRLIAEHRLDRADAALMDALRFGEIDLAEYVNITEEMRIDWDERHIGKG